MAVPVRPRPPSQAISTRSSADRSRTSRRAVTASAGSAGSRKSGQRTQRDSHRCSSCGFAVRYKPKSGAYPSDGSPRRRARPRTTRPSGSATTPERSFGHVATPPVCALAWSTEARSAQVLMSSSAQDVVASRQDATSHCPWSLPPAAITEPSARSPRVWVEPAATAATSRHACTSHCPRALSPAARTRPALVTPTVW